MKFKMKLPSTELKICLEKISSSLLDLFNLKYLLDNQVEMLVIHPDVTTEFEREI